MWMARFLTEKPRPPWWKALNWVLSQHNSGRFTLVLGAHGSGSATKLPACWKPYFDAWKQLHPQWSLDPDWTVREALCFPIPDTHSAQAREGLRLLDFTLWDPTTSTVQLISPAMAARQFGAPVRVGKALTALQDGSSAVPAQVLQLALFPSSTQPTRSRRRALYAHIQVAGVMLLSLTTALARKYIDRRKGLLAPFDWSSRGITDLGRPPPDIWSRLHSKARSPRQKETYYKFLFNALTLGARIRVFKPEKAHCHFCPDQVQTLRHFIFSCPLAQCLWQEFRSFFSLPSAVSLKQAAFSWSPNALVLGRRFGFRLQAGHAVVIHTLWIIHNAAVMDNRPTSTTAARTLFLSQLARHLETLRTAPSLHRHHQSLAD
jgi:hypothetical protein